VTLQRLARVAFAVGTVAIVVFSLVPARELPTLGLWDKLEHALSYAFVAVLGVVGWGGRARTRAVLAGMLISLGVILELLQSMVPGRLTDVADVTANIVGVVVGFGVLASLTRIAGQASRLGHPGR
jgi:VanZ family protein